MTIAAAFTFFNLLLPAILFVLFVYLYRITRKRSYLTMIFPAVYWFVIYAAFVYDIHYGDNNPAQYQVAIRTLFTVIGLSLIVFAVSEIAAARAAKRQLKE